MTTTLTPADSLECSHCGGPAITSANGLFLDGSGDRCEACGFPGSVVCDSETPADWSCSDEPDARCTDPACIECCERCSASTGGVCSKHSPPEPVEW